MENINQRKRFLKEITFRKQLKNKCKIFELSILCNKMIHSPSCFSYAPPFNLSIPQLFQKSLIPPSQGFLYNREAISVYYFSFNKYIRFNDCFFFAKASTPSFTLKMEPFPSPSPFFDFFGWRIKPPLPLSRKGFQTMDSLTLAFVFSLLMCPVSDE